MRILNSLIWGNSAAAEPQLATSGVTLDAIEIEHSNVEGCDEVVPWCHDGQSGPINNNIDADPLFVDAANGDYRLTANSPCIDAGDWQFLPCDRYTLSCDVLGVLDEDACAQEPNECDPPRKQRHPIDLDGIPRVVNGGRCEVDIGAFEFDPGIGCGCPEDLNGDCVVGVPDLLALLLCWGEVSSGCEEADLNDDGSVGVSDLLELLAA